MADELQADGSGRWAGPTPSGWPAVGLQRPLWALLLVSPVSCGLDRCDSFFSSHDQQQTIVWKCNWPKCPSLRTDDLSTAKKQSWESNKKDRSRKQRIRERRKDGEIGGYQTRAEAARVVGTLQLNPLVK